MTATTEETTEERPETRVEHDSGELRPVHARARCHHCGSTTIVAVCSSCHRLLCRVHDRIADLRDPWRLRKDEPAQPPGPATAHGDADPDDEKDGDGKDGSDSKDGGETPADAEKDTPGSGSDGDPGPVKRAVPAPESPQSTATPRRILERHFCPDCVPLGKPNDAVVQAAAAEVALGGLAAVWNPWIGGVLAAVGVFRIGTRVVAGRRRRRSTAPPAALFLDPRITKLELTETLRGTVVRRAGRSETSVTDVSGTVTMEAVWSRAHTAAVADHRRKLGLPASDDVEFSAGSLIVGGPGRLELPAPPVPHPGGTTIPMLLALRSRASDHAVLAHAAGRGDPRWPHTTAYTVDAREPDAPAPVWVTAALAPGSGGRALELDVQWRFTDPLDSAAKRAAAPQAERIEQLQLSVPGAWGEVENVRGAEHHTTTGIVAGRREITWERAKVAESDRGRCHLTVSFQRRILEKDPDVPPVVHGTLKMIFRKALSGATNIQVHAAGGGRRQDSATRRCVVRTEVELDLDLDLTDLRYQEVRTVPDPLRDGDEQRREIRRFRGVAPNHETVALLTDMLSDQGYYVKTVVENPAQTGAGGTRRRVWDISGRRYNGVHPISFHIGLTGDEIEKGQKAAGRRSSTRVRLNVSGTYANDDMEHDIVTEQAQLWDRIRATLAPSAEPSDTAPPEPTEPIDAASTEVVRMRHAALTLRERLHAAAERGEPADRLVPGLLAFIDEEFGVPEPPA